jgi:hypothetical protein
MDVLTTADDGTPTAESTVTGSTIASNESQGGYTVAEDAGVAIGGNAYTGGVTVSKLLDSTVADNSATGGQAYTVGSLFTTEAPGSATGGGFGPGGIGGYTEGTFFD